MPCTWRENASVYIACDTSRVGCGAAVIGRLCLSNGDCKSTTPVLDRRTARDCYCPGSPDNQQRNVRAEHDGDRDCEDDASCRDTVDEKRRATVATAESRKSKLTINKELVSVSVATSKCRVIVSHKTKFS